MSIGFLDQEGDLLHQTGISGICSRHQRDCKYGSFLVWSSRLAKSRVRIRLEESDCVELGVMVDWDNDIDNAIVAVDRDAGLD